MKKIKHIHFLLLNLKLCHTNALADENLGLMEIVKYIERVKETVKNGIGKMKLCLLVFVIERDTIVFIGFIIINIFSFKIKIQCNNY